MKYQRWWPSGWLASYCLVAVLPVPADCQIDVDGANDSPNQKDVTQFCSELADGSPYELYAKWDWDDVYVPGGNTNDGCILFDTDGDTNANLAVCVTTRDHGTPADLGAIRLFTCGDARPDRCTSPVQLAVNECVGGADDGTLCSIESDCAAPGVCVPVTANTACEVSQQPPNPTDPPNPRGDPFPAGNNYPRDTEALCGLDLDDFGLVGASARLIDSCSFPSESVNSDPSDCVSYVGCIDDTECDDNKPCTIDTCNTVDGFCIYTPDTGAPCGDPSDTACDNPDVCNDLGFCDDNPEPLSTPCEADGDLCTVEHCNGTGQCVFLNDVTCQPANPPCEGGAICNPTTGICDPQADAPLSTPCEAEGDLCTNDHCDGNGSCVFFERSQERECLADHYKCYKTRQTDDRFASRPVDLEDQFTSSTATVKEPVRLCNPVDKNGEGVADPTAHLMCYQIKEPRSEPGEVIVENQFGQQTLEVGKADSLCAPAEKDGVPSELNINHFKCYKARRASRQDKFTPREVNLEDQFETKLTQVIRPKFLCTPVDKNGEGLANPENHAVCYKIKDVPGQPRFQRQEVEIVDQFAQQDLKAIRGSCRRSTYLCVPSTKRIASPSGAFLDMESGVLD